jgi:hypothetical protein
VKADRKQQFYERVAMPIAAVTALRRQSSRGGHAPKRGGASNTQVNIKFQKKKEKKKMDSDAFNVLAV